MRIILSRAGYGKTKEMMGLIQKDMNKGKTIYLMVPEQSTLQTEMLVMDYMKAEAMTRLKVMSFERLAREVLTRTGGIKKTYIDEVGKHMALRRIFDQKKEDIQLFRTAFQKESFLSELSHTITEMKKIALSPEKIQASAGELGEDSLLAVKLKELGHIYEGLNEYMAGRYIDNEDRIGLLREKITKADYLQEVAFYFDGYSGFTVLELEVIQELGLLGSQVTLTLTLDRQNAKEEIFRKTAQTFRELQKRSKENNGELKVMELLESPIASPEIAFLEKNFQQKNFQQGEQSYQEIPGSLHLYEAMNLEQEVEYCAGEILRLVRDQGYRFRDISVIMAAPEAYGRKIKRIFTKYQLPHFLDVKKDIMGNNLLNMVAAFLDMLIYAMGHEDVFLFLKSDLTGLTREQYQTLENYALSWGITGRKWSMERYFTQERMEGYQEEDILQGREYLLELYNKYRKKFKKEETGEGQATVLYEFLTELQVEEKNNHLAQTLEAAGELDRALEVVQIWSILMNTLDQLVEIMGQRSLTLEEFKDVLMDGLQQQEVGTIPPTMDQIIVGTMDRSKSARARAVFLLGGSDNNIPRISGESMVLLDEEKTKLREMGIQLPSEMENKVSEEDFQIYNLMSSPREQLYISYALSDPEGKTQRPSNVVDSLLQMFPKLQVQGGLVAEGIDREIATPPVTLEKLSQALRDHLEGREVDPGWLIVYDWFKNQLEYKDQVDRFQQGLFFKNQKETLNKATTKKLYEPVILSATRLEKFAACPFAHLVTYGLKPQERKVKEIDALLLGTVFHSAVETFSRDLGEVGKLPQDWSQEQYGQYMSQIIDQSLTPNMNLLLEDSKRNGYMLKKVKKIAARVAWTMKNHLDLGRFTIYGQEVQREDRVIPLGEDVAVRITAKVDRVDVLTEGSNTYVKIIDYKSGEKDFSISDAFHGIDLQLVFYLDMMMEMIKENTGGQAAPGGAFYFHLVDKLINSESEDPEEIQELIAKELQMEGILLKDPRIVQAMDETAEKKGKVIPVTIKDGEVTSNNAFTQEEFMALIQHVRGKIRQLAGSILQGHTEVHPYTKKGYTACDYCRYAAICKFDPGVDSYRRLKEYSFSQVKEILENQNKQEGKTDEMDPGTAGSH